MTKSAVETVLQITSKIFQPLKDKLTVDNFVLFMAELGWEWSDDIPDFSNVFQLIDDLETAYTEIDHNKSYIEQLNLYDNLFNVIKSLTESINTIETFISHSPSSDFTSNIGKQVFDYLVCSYFEDNFPILFNSLRLIGVIEIDTIPFTDDHSIYTRRTINWSNLSDSISDFSGRIRRIYDWNHDSKEFNGQLFLDNLEEIMIGCGIPTGQYNINPTIAEKLYYIEGQEIDPAVWILNKELRIPLYEIADSEIGFTEAGFSIISIPDRTDLDKSLKGFAIAPYLEGELNNAFNLTDNLKLVLSSSIKTGFAINILPNKVDIIENIYGNIDFDGTFKVELIHSSKDGKIVILGEPGKSRFDYEKLSLCLQLKKTDNSTALLFELCISNSSIVIQSSDGDGFLQKVLPKDPLNINFDLTLGISNKKGFYISGGAGREYTFQINKNLGPIFLQTIDLGLSVNGEGLNLDTAMTGGVEIGPVAASVQKMGLKTFIDFDKKGNLGNADLSFGFKPPSGIAIAINAGGLTGGGGLLLDKPLYAGVLELAYENMFSIKVFGLVVTEMPDGQEGYSMLFMIMAEFSPIQLGLGFALKGVGGLIGIHRMMHETQLQLAVKNHSIDHILFPTSPVKDFILILETVQNVFPPKEDHHILGPMVKVIWGGSIDIIKFNIGLFLEFGGPLKLAILGQAKIELPDEENALVNLNIDVLGFIDFGNGTLALDCSIYDSRILILSIFGDMALRAGGDYFAFSLGGFHPKFSPPPGFPKLRRMTVMMSKGKAKATLTHYLAFTSNSFQIGAKLELIVKVSEFSVTGGVSFDALFIFSPFSFDVAFAIWFSVRCGNTEIIALMVSLNLTGPNPFVAKGKAKFKILFISISIPVKATFGEQKPDPLPIVSPFADLRNALNDQRCLSYQIPDWATDSMVFTENAQDYLDPIGCIIIKQKVVPLNFYMAKYGRGVPPESERKLSFTYIGSDNQPERVIEPVKEEFIPDQFKKMTDNERLSSPSFEEFEAGIKIRNHFVTKQDNLDLLSVDPTFETVLRESQAYLDSHEIKDEFQAADGEFSFADKEDLLFSLGYSSARNLRNPLRNVKDETHPNYIKVEPDIFGITDQNSNDGSFTHEPGISGTGNRLNFSQAQNLCNEEGSSNSIIMDAAMLV